LIKELKVLDGEYAVILIPEGFELSTAEQMGLNFIPSFTTQEVVLKIGGTSTHNDAFRQKKGVSTCLKEKKRGGGATMKVASGSAPMASGRPSISLPINPTGDPSGALSMVRRRRKFA
jgi:hypothetical protein